METYLNPLKIQTSLSGATSMEWIAEQSVESRSDHQMEVGNLHAPNSNDSVIPKRDMTEPLLLPILKPEKRVSKKNACFGCSGSISLSSGYFIDCDTGLNRPFEITN
jgi:hypothetical protein